MPSEDLKGTFYSLFDEAYNLLRANEGGGNIEQASANLCQRIEEEVAMHPILAKTVDEEILRWSLLTAFCEKTSGTAYCHDAIKCLVRANPISLLWRWGDTHSEPKSPIKTIAEGHPILMVWIAQEFATMLDHRHCLYDPPSLLMVRQYANNSHVEASVVQRFYELYPKGLKNKSQDLISSGYALQKVIGGWQECDADLFIFMASQYPKALAYRDRLGIHVLYIVCAHLAQAVDEDTAAPFQCSENMLRICRFIVDKCPELVSKKGRVGRGLPLHQLAKYCNRPLVQQAIILQLKHYPEAVEVRARSYLPDLKKEPFIQEIHPVVVLEADLASGKEWVVEGCANLATATSSLPSNHFLSIPTDIFASWVKSYETRLVEQLPSMIDDVCQKFAGPDVEEDEDDDEGLPSDEDDEDFDDSSTDLQESDDDESDSENP